MNYKSTHIELTIISHSGNSNSVKNRIINSINTYLIRNKGAVSDFNLIKDNSMAFNWVCSYLNYFCLISFML